MRELENLIERAVILSPGPRLVIPLDHSPAGLPRLPGTTACRRTNWSKRAHVVRVLDETNWIISGPRGTAARLGMKRTTLRSVYETVRHRTPRLIRSGA